MKHAMRWVVLALALATLPLFAQSPTRFQTPEAAAEALVEALGTQRADATKMAALFGKDWQQVLPVEGVDREDVDAFLRMYRQRHSMDTAQAGKAFVRVGDGGWTFPVPLVKEKNGWRFDTRAGAEEMRVRRIGRNELAAVESVRTYHDAQLEYAEADRDGDGVLEYARKFMSTDGLHDGLFWSDDDSGDISPLGPLFGDETPKGEWHGYRFRILEAQGPSAPGGAYSYLLGKDMSRGFALVAWPAKYGETGVMSFMISQDGDVFEKDMGKGTERIARSMRGFEPDSSWTDVEEPVAAGTATK